MIGIAIPARPLAALALVLLSACATVRDLQEDTWGLGVNAHVPYASLRPTRLLQGSEMAPVAGEPASTLIVNPTADFYTGIDGGSLYEVSLNGLFPFEISGPISGFGGAGLGLRRLAFPSGSDTDAFFNLKSGARWHTGASVDPALEVGVALAPSGGTVPYLRLTAFFDPMRVVGAGS